jgi:hypothetical protein
MPRSIIQMMSVAVMAAVLRPLPGDCFATWKDIPDARSQAALVFRGTVIDKKPHPNGVSVMFDVDRVWKGPRQRRLVLPQFILSTEDFGFQQGEKYLVFANRYEAPPGNADPRLIPSVPGPLFFVSSPK